MSNEIMSLLDRQIKKENEIKEYRKKIKILNQDLTLLKANITHLVNDWKLKEV